MLNGFGFSKNQPLSTLGEDRLKNSKFCIQNLNFFFLNVSWILRATTGTSVYFIVKLFTRIHICSLWLSKLLDQIGWLIFLGGGHWFPVDDRWHIMAGRITQINNCGAECRFMPSEVLDYFWDLSISACKI